MSLNESIIEDAPLTSFGALDYTVGHGPATLRDTLLPKLLSGEITL